MQGIEYGRSLGLPLRAAMTETALNREEVDISFVFFSTRISKLVLILLCLGIGFVLGYLFDGWRRRRSGWWG